MGKKGLIVAGILSSLVGITGVAAQTGYKESTGQIAQAFTMAFSWLPVVLKIKPVVFGVLVILFWILLYNIILVGVKRWLVKEGETTKMHKAIAGSMAGIIILSVFFLTKDPMGKAQQIAGSFGMFFAIIISGVVYFVSKSMIRSNSDGETGGFQSTMLGALCLLLFTYLAEGTAWGGIRYLLMGVALLILFFGMIMKVGGVARGWGCSGGYDAFGDRSDQLPRSPGSAGDAASRLLGRIAGLASAPGNILNWWERAGTSEEQRAFDDTFTQLENTFRTHFTEFQRIYDFFEQKITQIPEMLRLYHLAWSKCNKFIESVLPRLLQNELRFVDDFLRNLTAGSHTAERLLTMMGEAAPGRLTNTQRRDILAGLTHHSADIQHALINIRDSVVEQIAIVDRIRANTLQTQTLLSEIITNHLSPGTGEFDGIEDLHTALEALRGDIQTILAGAPPVPPPPHPGIPPAIAAELTPAVLDFDTGRDAFIYGPNPADRFRTLREFIIFFKTHSPTHTNPLFVAHVESKTPATNDFANWIQGSMTNAAGAPLCPNLAAHIRTLITFPDFMYFITSLPS